MRKGYLQRVIRNMRKLWPFYLNVEVNGHSEYVRFIILGRERTGSTFLRSLLNTHRRIIAWGEIFRDYNAICWDYPLFPQYRSLLSLILSDPIRFLERKVFKRLPLLISAVGFKIFYHHAQNESWKPVWTYLRSQKDLRIIHLKRQNILKTYLSYKKAELTNSWLNMFRPEADNLQILLDYEQCLQTFSYTREQERKYDLFFADHRKIEVLYENLSANYHRETKRIQEFLGVDDETVEPVTYKQAAQPLSVAISNYFELKERFSGTPWEAFFED